MKIINKIDLPLKEEVTLTIGSFDGIHIGHQYVINKCVEIAKTTYTQSLIYTFEPHPKIVIPYDGFKLLTVLKEKLFILKNFEIDFLYIQEFNKDFANLQPSEFLKILFKNFGIKNFVIGYDNRFGKDRRGDFDFLLNISKENNFNLIRLEQILYKNQKVKSTQIRRLIHDGRIEEANNLLGYPYIIYGQIEKGLGLGKKIGYPTLNLKYYNYKLYPPNGVYFSLTLLKNVFYKSLLYIGKRPTFMQNNVNITIENYLLNYDNFSPVEELFVFVFKYFRPDIKFENADDLRRQIEIDIRMCENFFKNITLERNIFITKKFS